MPFLVTVGDSLQSAMDQAKLIIGNAPAIDEGHADNMSYFEYSSKSPVSSQPKALQAGIAGQQVFVYWVVY